MTVCATQEMDSDTVYCKTPGCGYWAYRPSALEKHRKKMHEQQKPAEQQILPDSDNILSPEEIERLNERYNHELATSPVFQNWRPACNDHYELWPSYTDSQNTEMEDDFSLAVPSSFTQPTTPDNDADDFSA